MIFTHFKSGHLTMSRKLSPSDICAATKVAVCLLAFVAACYAMVELPFAGLPVLFIVGLLRGAVHWQKWRRGKTSILWFSEVAATWAIAVTSVYAYDQLSYMVVRSEPETICATNVISITMSFTVVVLGFCLLAAFYLTTIGLFKHFKTTCG